MKTKTTILMTLTAALMFLLAACTASAATLPTTPSTPPETQNPAADRNTVYKLDWYLDSSGIQVQVLPEAEITAQMTGSEIAGSSGCNSYSASVQVSGGQIEVGDIVSTLMACADPVMDQEQAYLETLKSAVSFEVSGDVLTLYDDQNTVILSFTAAP